MVFIIGECGSVRNAGAYEGLSESDDSRIMRLYVESSMCRDLDRHLAGFCEPTLVGPCQASCECFTLVEKRCL